MFQTDRWVAMTNAVGAEATHNVANRATRVIAATMGVLVGLGSIDHGVLECLQGARPTTGLIVNALGPGYNWTLWKQGGEGAFTLLPNFLLSGIVATLLGVLMIVWALCFLQSRRGSLIFLALGVISFLTGGGVAQVILFALTWAVARKINAPLPFWRRFVPTPVRRALGCIWPWTLTASAILFLAALEIAVFGYVPGVSGQLELLHLCWGVLGAALGLYLISVFSGFLQDAQA
jgi:hypothetical protein